MTWPYPDSQWAWVQRRCLAHLRELAEKAPSRGPIGPLGTLNDVDHISAISVVIGFGVDIVRDETRSTCEYARGSDC